MTGEEIALALGELPDDLIQGAMESGGRTSLIPGSAKRLVACIAILIAVVSILFWSSTLPPNVVEAEGLLKVTTYSSDGSTSTELVQGVMLPWEYDWNLAISSQIGLPLTLSIPDENYPGQKISFEVSVSDGSYQTWMYSSDTAPTVINLGQDFVVDNPAAIYWWNISFATQPDDNDSFNTPTPFWGDTVYTDIVIKADNHIVGYAVIKIYKTAANTLNYGAVIEKSIAFPLIEGSFQEITRTYIDEEIAHIHD